MNLTLDVDKLTMGDLEDFEDKTGRSMLSLAGEDFGSLPSRTLTALIWITGRADDPDFTWDDARKVRLADLDSDTAVEKTPDPTDGGS